MSINSIQIRNFMGMFEENTIIGGVSDVLNTPYKLAQKLGVSVSRIEGFRIVGDDIEFRVKDNYYISRFFTTTSLPSLPNITKYDDKSGLATINDRQTFQNSSYLKWVSFPETTTLGNYCFLNCTALEYAYIPKTETLTNGANGGAFDGCSNPNIVAYLSSVKTITGYYTFRNSGFKILELPSLESIISNSNNYNNHFYGMVNLEKLSMRKLKIWTWVGINYDLYGIKMNSLIEVNKELDTLEPLYPLIYAYCARDAKVDFYDDNGEFVNTLAPTPNISIEGIQNDYPTKQSFRAKLPSGGTTSMFGNYIVSDDKVEYYVHSSFSMSNVFQNNTNIKSYKDTSDIPNLSALYFNKVFDGATNLEVVEIPKLKFIGASSFINTKVKTLIFDEATTVSSQSFTSCPELEYISLASLTSLLSTASSVFASNPKLKEVNAPLINNLPNSSYYSNPLLERALHDYVESLGTYVFYRNYAIKEISLKRAKVLGTGLQTDQIFTDIGQRCSIKINIATDSTNNGSTDGNLMYAWLERDAVVEFYDDNLEYVKTLSRPTNFTIKGIGTQFPDKVSFRDYVGTNRNMRFGSYTVTDNDVSFYLDSAVKLSSTFDGNENITEFISTSGKLTQATWEDLNSTFKNAINLRVYDVPETTNVGVDVFLNTKIEVLDLPNVINIQSASFSSMYLVKTINLPILTTLNNGNTRSFYDCPLLEEVNAPKITFMTDSFYYDCIGLKRAIHNEVTNMIGVGRQFYNCQSIERIELKKCKGIGTENTNSNVFYNIKLGCEIHIHIYNKTSNNGGLNVNLEYAKTQRNAIISFYDDNGTLIETI